MSGARAIGTGPDWLARIYAGGVDKLLDRIDEGLESGSIDTTLPNGEKRMLGGRKPGFDAVVNLSSYRAMLRLATGGSVGWFQAWEAGEWDSPDPVALFALFQQNATSLGQAGRAKGPWRLVGRTLHFLNRNTRAGSRRNIHAHYDLGNDFYRTWLDPTMTYSSARFDKGANSLEVAQRRKIETVAERLGEPETVLEIGCGWGSLARQLAERGSRVTAISLSDDQLEWARANHGSAEIEFRKQDYRDVDEQFDAIASVEMVEAVGRSYWPDYFDCIARNLRPGGRAALQLISIRDALFESYARGVDFIQAYIFPGGMLASETEFRALAEERGLTWQDRVGFGLDYAETLKRWRANFDRVVAEGRLPKGFDERFVRLWRYYLMYCEGGFRGGGIDVAQVTLVKEA